MKSAVYFKPLPPDMSAEDIGREAVALFEKAGARPKWGKNDLIAVKIHFGEKGNLGHINARTAGVLCRHFMKSGTRPFLTDTNTLYRGQRDNAWNHLMLAHEHGFSIENCGVPVLISDGLKGQSQVPVPVKGELLQQVFLGSDIASSAGIVGLSHFTGHLLTGYGATVKNLGMGCAGRGGKLSQHSDVKPEVKSKSCTACGTCVKWCPAGAITIKGTAIIDLEKCIGCGECFSVCPSAAIKHSWQESSDRLQKKMAEHALGAVSGKEDKSCYFNFLTHFTKDCDCMSCDPPLIPDIGIFFSADPVAVDQAAFDQLRKSQGDDFLARLWPGVNQDEQLSHAIRIGLGSREYDLIET
ncbi:MAG: DUF362 domain-containing protein [Candidatus Wallbacteria bacterium]|nr:DUF362 domain-containing protein [Candidatus Wallbacteria bacterium]